jgi:hypothetical protein
MRKCIEQMSTMSGNNCLGLAALGDFLQCKCQKLLIRWVKMGVRFIQQQQRWSICCDIGGYTLEALLGITPNGKSEPDYLRWEIKGHSSNRVTLMTPEPNGGFYGERGVKEFVERYGHDVDDGGMHFTGGHKVGVRCVATGMTLQVSRFDPVNPKLFDVCGAVRLVVADGNEAASWAIAQLLTHWNRKHAFAAYIRDTLEQRNQRSKHEVNFALTPTIWVCCTRRLRHRALLGEGDLKSSTVELGWATPKPTTRTPDHPNRTNAEIKLLQCRQRARKKPQRFLVRA